MVEEWVEGRGKKLEEKVKNRKPHEGPSGFGRRESGVFLEATGIQGNGDFTEKLEKHVVRPLRTPRQFRGPLEIPGWP